jgi:hypothetical protein
MANNRPDLGLSGAIVRRTIGVEDRAMYRTGNVGIRSSR